MPISGLAYTFVGVELIPLAAVTLGEFDFFGIEAGVDAIVIPTNFTNFT